MSLSYLRALVTELMIHLLLRLTFTNMSSLSRDSTYEERWFYCGKYLANPVVQILLIANIAVLTFVLRCIYLDAGFSM
jgi:hypothetical protein